MRRIARGGGDASGRDAVALGLVDAVADRDSETLSLARDALRDARIHAEGEAAGWLDAAVAFAHWGLERSPSADAIARGTQAHGFLAVLADVPHVGSAELRRLLEVDETQVSRTGRRLLESGLVTRRKAGRQVFWTLTPRGRRALDEAPAATASRGSEFWQDALRRGFERAYGDQPGEPREVDPTRERIIESTLELHVANGIKATTWEQIADRSGVPAETISQLFPTFDELTTSCAQHFMETLALPPRDLAPKVYAGASSGNERIHRMVETFFGAYERGAEGITIGRRERDVPAARESTDELENTFDALVVEALHPDASSLTALRALTDVEVWRTLRDQGATAAVAVDQATAAVERWLEARPAR